MANRYAPIMSGTHALDAKDMGGGRSAITNIYEEEDWESGSAEGWQDLLAEGDGGHSFVQQTTPKDGNFYTVRIKETQGGGTDYAFGYGQTFSQWDGEWTIDGLFKQHNITPSASFQAAGFKAYYDGTDSGGGVRLDLGVTDSNGNLIPVAIKGSLISSQHEATQFSWGDGKWWWFKLYHDGNGEYHAKVWRDGNGEPASATAYSTGSAPGTQSRYMAMWMNGASGHAHYYDYDYIRFRNGDYFTS